MAFVTLMHLKARVCPLAATPCLLGGSASASLLPASAFLPASIARSQLSLPREIVRFQGSLGTRRIVSNGVRVEGGRAGGEKSAPEGSPPVDGRLHQRSAQTHTNDTGIVGRAAVLLKEDVITEPLLKICAMCQRSKPSEDFEVTITSSDGRSEGCRACLAAVKAMRAGKELYHLSLSIDEAWALAKPCSKCGLVKELRDFARSAATKDHLAHRCRACLSAKHAREPRHVPTDQPQQCIRCLEVKAADQFYIDRRRQKGRNSACKLCAIKRTMEASRRNMEARMYIKRKTKLCTGCRKEKPASEFHVAGGAIDGLYCYCRLCRKVSKQSGQQELGPS